MSILEELRKESKELPYWGEPKDLRAMIIRYNLALENALLKLKNRAVEIKDLKHRLKLFEYPSLRV